MTDNDIKTISEKIDSLHKKILKSKFAEQVTESEMVSLILAVQGLNQQKAELELKTMDVNSLTSERDALQEMVVEQKAEIERLQSLQKPTGAGGYKIEKGKVVFYSDMLNGYRHEYKDLDEVVKELNLYMHTDYKNIELISHYKHKAKTAKSEAIKEFAERLKEKYKFYGSIGKMELYKDLDNLLKEMEGEENA